MKALSIKQPWAILVVKGLKDVENRTWRIGRNPRLGLPTRVFIHAGKVSDAHSPIFTDDDGLPLIIPDSYYGAIIGEVDIVDCIRDSTSRWAMDGQWHFVLANPVEYDQPIPCKGQLGFFDVTLPGADTEYSPVFRDS